MSESGHKSSTHAVEKTQTVTINIEPLLMPISLFLSSLVLAGGLLLGLNAVSRAIEKVQLNVSGTTATTGTTTPTTATDTAGTTPVVSVDSVKALWDKQNGIKFGDKNSKVLLVEFSDPSCPYCHIAGGKNGQLNKEVGDRFLLVQDGGTYLAPIPEFKKLLDEGKASYAFFYTNGHGNGEMGTKALYCAQDQGKFWEAHDLLYSNAGYSLLNDTVKNDKTKSNVLSDFMKGVLDAGKLKECLDAGKYDSRIAEDSADGKALGVAGTPGFFVNGTNFAGAYSYNDMKSVVDAALGS